LLAGSAVRPADCDDAGRAKLRSPTAARTDAAFRAPNHRVRPPSRPRHRTQATYLRANAVLFREDALVELAAEMIEVDGVGQG
jgi:hypothetical protein